MPRSIQENLFWIMVVFLAIGFYYPAVGILALICMLGPVIMSFYRGRFWCGNFCPRGSFYDAVVSRISPHREIPAFFRHPWWRLFMVGFIMVMFSIQAYFAWGSMEAMGMVFIRLILVTTAVGLVLGVIFHQRTWCSFCPMGTMAHWVSASRRKRPLMVADSCVGCQACAKVCPLQLQPFTAKGQAAGFVHSDCLKCGRCVAICPKQALSFSFDAGKEGTR
jgi:ferredoxin-type protein NapH